MITHQLPAFIQIIPIVGGQLVAIVPQPVFV